MRRLFEGGAYSSNYCNWQLKSLLHLGQIVITLRTLLHLGQNAITFRTLLHLGPFITFRPSTASSCQWPFSFFLLASSLLNSIVSTLTTLALYNLALLLVTT